MWKQEWSNEQQPFPRHFIIYTFILYKFWSEYELRIRVTLFFIKFNKG